MTTILSCSGQSVAIDAEGSEALGYVRSLDRVQLQEATVRDTSDPFRGPWLLIEQSQDASLTFSPDPAVMRLRADWSAIDRSGLIENLLVQIIAWSCFENAMVPIHAAAVGAKGRAYVFVGEAGSGKTSMAFVLTQQFGCQWIANDRTAFALGSAGQVQVCAGDEYLDLRRMMLNGMRDHLTPDMQQRVAARISSSADPWAKANPPLHYSEFGMKLCSLPCPIGGLFFLNTAPGGEFYAGRAPIALATMLLLREVAWAIRGVRAFPIDNAGRLLAPSVTLEPRQGWESAIEALNTLTMTVPSWVIRGPLEVAVEFVRDIISE